jgi:hypothetical protein
LLPACQVTPPYYVLRDIRLSPAWLPQRLQIRRSNLNRIHVSACHAVPLAPCIRMLLLNLPHAIPTQPAEELTKGRRRDETQPWFHAPLAFTAPQDVERPPAADAPREGD